VACGQVLGGKTSLDANMIIGYLFCSIQIITTSFSNHVSVKMTMKSIDAGRDHGKTVPPMKSHLPQFPIPDHFLTLLPIINSPFIIYNYKSSTRHNFIISSSNFASFRSVHISIFYNDEGE
jgi:hypothetical protein